MGPVEAGADTRKTIPLSPILGGLPPAGGYALAIIGHNKPQLHRRWYALKNRKEIINLKIYFVTGKKPNWFNRMILKFGN